MTPTRKDLALAIEKRKCEIREALPGWAAERFPNATPAGLEKGIEMVKPHLDKMLDELPYTEVMNNDVADLLYSAFCKTPPDGK